MFVVCVALLMLPLLLYLPHMMLLDLPGRAAGKAGFDLESRPLSFISRFIRTPLRLQRRYHADPLLKYAAFVVYIHMPIANYAVASSLTHQSLPTHHTIWWWRVDLYTSCFASIGAPLPTTATVPRRSIANRRCNRRLHTYANRKLRSSKLFGPSEPSYTPYQMMA